MKPITQNTVLEAIPSDHPISFWSLAMGFIADEERQYQRLEKTLEKLHMQQKIEVVKDVNPLAIFFPTKEEKNGSMLRYYKFKRNKE